MQYKFGKNGIILKIYSIMYSIYYSFIEKSKLKEDVLIRFGYFLLNKLKNFGYCVYLCSKMKFNNYLKLYYKFNLMEDLKEYLLQGLLNKVISKDSYFHVEVTSVILYYKYIEDLKLKIYDATTNQVEYFEILKANTQINNQSSKKLLLLGTKLLELRKEIISLWGKIIELNPFSIEAEKDYLLYIENIIQDEELLREESKKFLILKIKEEKNKGSKYYNLFDKNNTILLVDGYNSKGKILYFSPNFPEVFNISPKECLTLSNHDLMPKCISEFHEQLIKDILKFSNLKLLYKREITISIKVKDTLYNTGTFVKILPNLSTGLIYLVTLRKLELKHFIIETDSLFRIHGMTDNINILTNTQDIQSQLGGFPYLLNKIMLGKSIILLVPDILKYIIYEDQKYIIDPEKREFSGNFFTNTQTLREIEINNILDKIKEHRQLLFMFESKKTNPNSSIISKRRTDINIDFIEFTNIYNNCKNAGGQNIPVIFRTEIKSFLNDKYTCFKFYIKRDGNVEEILNYSSILKPSSINISKKNTLKTKPKNIHIKVKEKNSSSEKKSKEKEEEAFNVPYKNIKIKNSKEIENLLIKKTSSKKIAKIQNDTIYQNIKSKIINKENPRFIKLLSIIITIFSILTFILITLNNLSIDNKFNKIRDFLTQNYYVNTTKIQSSALYIITSEFLLFQLETEINDILCIGTCKESYLKSFKEVLEDIKSSLSNVLNIDDDLKYYIFSKISMLVYIDNKNPPYEQISDSYSLLYFTISECLKIIEYIDLFLDGNDLVNIQIHNTLLNSYSYPFNDDIGYGFHGDEKIKKLNESKFNMSMIFLNLNLTSFLIAFFLAFYIIFKKYQNEIYNLRKIIDFQSDNFDKYLKYLQNLKKKLKNEANEKEEENNEEELITNKPSKKKDKTKDKKNGKDKLKKKEKDKKDNEIKKTHNKREKKAKINKMYQQKNEKKKIMSKFFFQQNMISAYKIGSIFIFAMLYYLLIYFLYKIQKNKYISYDDIENEVISTALNTFMDYIIIKHLICDFSSFITEQTLCYNKFIQNIESSCIINYNVYTQDNFTQLKFIFPDLSYLHLYKKNEGTLVLNLIDNNNMNSNDILYKFTKIHTSDMCKGLSDYISINYTHCSNFWDSILLQGLKQSTIYSNNLLKVVIQSFNEYNEDQNNYKLMKSFLTFFNIEIFIINYFFPAIKYEIALFDLLKKEKIDKMFILFNSIVYCSAVEIIILYSILMTSIYQMKKTNSLMNFVIIFPLKYVHEKKEFYNDIINLSNDYF